MTAVLAAAQDTGKAAPVGLFLILSLLIVVFFLGRSMRTHLRRVPLEFPDQPASPPREPDSLSQDGVVLEGEVMDRPEDEQGPTVDRPQRPDTPRPDSV